MEELMEIGARGALKVINDFARKNGFLKEKGQESRRHRHP